MDNPNPAVPEPEEEASSSEGSFAEILWQFEQEHLATSGRALEGVVVAMNDDFVFVDIGRKMEGVLPVAEFRDESGALTVGKGYKMVVTISGTTAEGLYRLSTLRVEKPKDWSSLESAFAEKRTIQGTVKEAVKGGLRVDVGVPAFMPASRSGARDQAELEQLIGKDIECRIIKLDVADEDVVVDRRVVLEEGERAAREQVFASLQEGAVVKGKVRNLTDFGAFVDLGGVDGLLHVADLSWHRIAKPADVLRVDDEVEVKILKINAANHKISLGMKQLTPEPWALAADKYKQGDRVKGKVVRISDFGAFVELEPGVDGLIHVSEMSWSKKQRKPSDIVSVGEVVEVVILSVNPGEKRVALGLKQALGDPWEETVRKYPAGSVVEGPVTSLQKFGAFVELAEGVEGMIHIGDISREKRLNHPKEVLKVGQVVKAQVLEVERTKRRFRLGMKQLEPTNADQYIAEHKPGDPVTGRVVELSGDRGKVELGDGVFTWCTFSAEAEKPEAEAKGTGDLSSLTARLAAKWKSGAADSGAGGEGVRAGQIRSFHIVALDAAQKRIEIEPAG